MMQAVISPRGDSRTYLTHFIGSGLDDERYVAERFRSLANGDIVSVHADGARPKGRRQGCAQFFRIDPVFGPLPLESGLRFGHTILDGFDAIIAIILYELPVRVKQHCMIFGLFT